MCHTLMTAIKVLSLRAFQRMWQAMRRLLWVLAGSQVVAIPHVSRCAPNRVNRRRTLQLWNRPPHSDSCYSAPCCKVCCHGIRNHKPLPPQLLRTSRLHISFPPPAAATVRCHLTAPPPLDLDASSQTLKDESSLGTNRLWWPLN